MRVFLVLVVFFAKILAFSFSGEVDTENEQALIFYTNNTPAEKINSITDNQPFSCYPNIQGAVEYTNNSLIFYTQNLHAGFLYKCKLNNSEISFSSRDFGVKSITKNDDNRYILSFFDEVSIDEIDKKLIIENTKFKTKKLTNTDFLITLSNNLQNPKFYLPKDFKSEFNATLNEEFSLVYQKDIINEYEFNQNIKQAKTLPIIKVEPIGLENGLLGIRIYLNDWLYENKNLKKYVRISNINRFDISQSDYVGYMQDSPGAYAIDISSTELKPQSKYKVEILQGFGDYYTATKQKYEFEITTTDYEPFVTFADEKPYISSLGEIGIKSTNVKKIKASLEQLSDENYRYFLNLNNGSLNHLTNEVVTKEFELNTTKNKISEHKIKLNFKNVKDGVYKLNLHYDNDKIISKNIYLSDIAINVKLARDEIFVFANRLSQNAMLSGANVKIYSNKNELLSTGATNDEGVYTYKSDEIYKHAASVVVSLGDEQNFIILNQDDKLNENAYYKIKQDSDIIDAYVYFASSLIRPNEEIKAAIYLKDANFKPIKSAPIKLIITDPRGKKIDEILTKTDELGIISIDKKINSNLTGTFELSIIHANKIIKNKSFYIESFVPTRVKNEILGLKDEYQNGEILTAKLGSHYLFGGIANDISGEAILNISDAEYTNENYKNYKFSNDYVKNINAFSQIKSINLDKNGTSNVSFMLKTQNGAKSILNLTLTYEANDDGNMVSTAKTAKLYPYKNIIGINVSKNFIEPNEKITINSVVLDSKDKSEQNATIKYEINRLTWQYNMDANYKASWFKTLEKIDEFISTNNKFDYTLANSGEYSIIATHMQSGASASIDISVSGYNYGYTAPTHKLSSANIKLDAKSYKEGDTINADITSVIKDGLGLITLEANGIKAYKLVAIKNHSASVKFPINFDFNGAYISASIYKIADNKSHVFRSFAKVYADAKMDNKEIKVQLNSPKTAKSNQNININLKTIPNADVMLFIADIGVLNIISQDKPNPLSFFNKKLNDGVFDYDIYSYLSGYKANGKTLNFGGDMLRMAMMSKHESPVDTKNVQTYVKMIRLKADENGEINYNFKTPNAFNSSIRIDAIVANESGFGTASGEITIKDDIIIKPTQLLYMLKGDEINANLRLINTTNEDKNVSISVKSSENLNIKLNKETLTLKPNENTNINMVLTAKNNAKATYKISLNNDEYTNENKLDIINPHPISTHAKSLSVKGSKSIKLPNGYENVSLNVSSSPLSLLNAINEDLIIYPYGCAEQRSSRLLALLYANSKNKYEQDDRQNFIELGIKDIEKMKNEKGEIGYWGAFSYVDDFSFIYAVDVLSDITKAGFSAELKDSIKAINSRLQADIFNEFNALYAAYVLSRHNALKISTLNALFDSKIHTKSQLRSYLLAATLKNAGLEAEAKKVANDAKNLKLNIDDKNFSSMLRDKAFVLYLHAMSFEKSDFSDTLANELLKQTNSTNSTQEKAFILRAFNSYFKNEQKIKNFKLIYNEQSHTLDTNKTHVFTPKNGEFVLFSSAEMFASYISNAYITPKINHKNDSAKPLNIYRTYIDKDGKDIDINNLKINELIYSKLEISSKDNIEVGVINEIISPCFEVVNENLQGDMRTQKTTNTLNTTHQIIKDDRVLSFFNIANNQTATLYTPMRVMLSGKCQMPAVSIENMYNQAQNDYDLQMNEIVIK
ncbi:alpha-2-macroglobulin family protein [Campylobacter majalis]|uniref:alpha-2-macroglobulin family protein n=1 Tax=Campylobacter majalis TaxID=2790656 RepID=UPI003D689897